MRGLYLAVDKVTYHSTTSTILTSETFYDTLVAPADRNINFSQFPQVLMSVGHHPQWLGNRFLPSSSWLESISHANPALV